MKRRHLSIHARTTVAQKMSADYKEKLPIFHTYCSNKITNKKIQPNHITNMDKVPLTFDIPVARYRYTPQGMRSRLSLLFLVAMVSALTVVRAIAKAGIIAEQPPGNETDSDNDEREPGMFDGEIAQLLKSDTEDEDFDGFLGED
ncbi:hypothetical protein NDU88_001302 [Pleurodeles waltl]|uniref:Uncharacterized protein n=1 Tax=Pleurodeles waltl TaxID=8319 RepID=A0AAV7W032_PLEWA|nr:hypothetical protein NDU88_001302 [Pleurodeles waltl]